MPRKKVEAHAVERNGRRVWRVIIPRELSGGQRRTRYFRVKEDATDFARQTQQERSGAAEEFFRLSGREQSAVIRAVRILGSRVGEIEDASAAWMRAQSGPGEKLDAVVAECLAAKLQAGRRKHYISTFKSSMKSLVAALPGRGVREVTAKDVERWLNGNEWKAATRRGYLIDARTLLAYALRRGYVSTNVAEQIEKPTIEPAVPGIFTVEQCVLLMAAVVVIDPGLAPFVAVQLFGGLRPIEAQKLNPSEIRGGHLHILASKSKTRRRRLVPINATLQLWLDIGAYDSTNWRRRLMAIRRAVTGLPWPHDVLRHTYVSHALPIHGASMVALWCGHSEQVLFAHYRELVTTEDAERFWKIRP